jgi:hypothetical protein
VDRRDYIMRMIEQLGTILVALRRRIIGQEVGREEAAETLRETARLGGLDYDLARAMAPETLLLMVAPGGDVDPGRCWLVAELSYLDGLDAALASDFEEARDGLERAAYLFGLLQPLAGNFLGVTEADDRLEEIEQRLAALRGLPG